MPARPVIVRLAGLPVSAVELLTSRPCAELLQARESLEEKLGEARRLMVETISRALPGFDAAGRRFLLAVKRSCFNGRSIGTYRGKPDWASLLRADSDLAERIVALEAAIEENNRAFSALHAQELTRERRHVLELVEDRRFLRGIALGRPGLVQMIRFKAPALAMSELLREPSKWEQSLLRFVTRAATKLSANSTFTAYALGSVQASMPSAGLRFTGPPQKEVSLVRANRPELEQFQELLMRHPAVRARGLVAWNDSFEQLEPDQYRLLRRGRWDLDPGAEAFHFIPPSRIKVRLSNPLLGAAEEALRDGALRYDRLLARLGPGETDSPEARSSLDQLVDLGILILMPPWPTHEARLEQEIGRFLKALPDAPGLRAIADALQDLLTLEEGYVVAAEPESSVAQMQDAFSRLLATVTPLAGHQGPLAARTHFFEDVFWPGSDEDLGILEVEASKVEEILHGSDLVSRFAGLFNLRHDVLHTLAAWWREHQPGRREIPFPELAQQFAPVWKQFPAFHKTANDSALNTFDPLRADALEELRERRKALLSRSRELLSTSPGLDEMSARQLEELLKTLPHRYTPLLGSCVFVQPADFRGDSWVVNRLSEGTGRYLSRVTPVLEEPLRQPFLDHMTARSVVHVDGEEADLLEVKHPWGNLVSAHEPQAVKVLDLPGLYAGLPRRRLVGLKDLRVQADLDSDTFRLIDSSGRRVLPVHLSSMTNAGLPPLLGLLLMFGPGEARGVFPFPRSEAGETWTSSNRLACARLVIRRRRWEIDIKDLAQDLGGTDAQSYIRIRKWRLHLGLPSAGFYYERTFHGAFKPQYVDFDSPSLCRLFVSSLEKKGGGRLVFEEALPAPTDFPFDAQWNRRGIELLIDSLAIRTRSGNSTAWY